MNCFLSVHRAVSEMVSPPQPIDLYLRDTTVTDREDFTLKTMDWLLEMMNFAFKIDEFCI